MSSDADDPALMATVGTIGPTTSAVRAPLARRALGRYQLEGVIGEGAMGEVHRALDLDLERQVAIKVLHADSVDGGARLLREARAMARLDHPNVVKIYEVDTIEGIDFVVMELVFGESLARWLHVPRTPLEIVRAFVAAGHGLAAAHAVGMVHRDFKPANVLRGERGAIKVGDFGLARDSEESASEARPSHGPGRLADITHTGAMVGTPAYMAPEQWASGAISPAADQFAFCVALWEALVGERPFRGGSLAELRAAIEAGPGDPVEVPRPYRAALVRGLATDPARRWPSMEALLEQLAPAEPVKRWWIVAATVAIAAVLAGSILVIRDSDDRHAKLADDPHPFVPVPRAALIRTIVPLAPSHFLVPRSTVTQILTERTELTETLRAVATKDASDTVIGYRLFAIRPASVAARIGLRDGDQMRALDEIPFDSQDHVIQAFHRAQTSNQLLLHFTRRGVAQQIEIDVFP